jgi:ribosomal protein S18 acetylase RimI-like enzyme
VRPISSACTTCLPCPSTAAEYRGQGLAAQLCEHLLSLAASDAVTVAYLQVAAQNWPALAVYRRLGFADAYGYHYRLRPGDETKG